MLDFVFSKLECSFPLHDSRPPARFTCGFVELDSHLESCNIREELVNRLLIVSELGLQRFVERINQDGLL